VTDPAIIEAALAYLEAREATAKAMLDAKMASKANDPNADQLDAMAGDCAEAEETARRVLGDAIIRADPKMQERVRKTVRFSADDTGIGVLIPLHATLK
jgi:hypothetical protein